MSLAEQVRLRLEVADRAMAFYSAACHADGSEQRDAFAKLGAAIEAVDAYENPPAQVAVQEREPVNLHQVVRERRQASINCGHTPIVHAMERARVMFYLQRNNGFSPAQIAEAMAAEWPEAVSQ